MEALGKPLAVVCCAGNGAVVKPTNSRLASHSTIPSYSWMTVQHRHQADGMEGVVEVVVMAPVLQ